MKLFITDFFEGVYALQADYFEYSKTQIPL